MHGTDSPYHVLEVCSAYKTKDSAFYFNGESPLLQCGEVRKCSSYEQKE